jgi:hypothetical protein
MWREIALQEALDGLADRGLIARCDGMGGIDRDVDRMLGADAFDAFRGVNRDIDRMGWLSW